MSKLIIIVAIAASAVGSLAHAQSASPQPPVVVAGAEPAPQPEAQSEPEQAQERRPFHFGGEVKLGARSSRDVRSKVNAPFPPDFFAPGETAVYMRTVSPAASVEIQNVALIGEGDLAPGIAAKVRIHFLDLYNRTPTSSDDRVFVREAWLRFGRQFEPLEAVAGSSIYALVGMAPRFTKPQSRRLESYGLWTTAVGRFENPQVQVGGTVGRHVYWRASGGNGNPLFMRDPNVLAGDNGTPERVPGNVHPIYESGFPILYDAKAQDLNPRGKFEYGVGGGYRVASEAWALDVLGWYFHRDLLDAARLRGTYYSGDLKILTGAGYVLPVGETEKIERGLNVEARAGRLRVWGQYVDQEIAGLPRRGYEVETAYHIPLDGWFLAGETVVGRWIQPVVRVSYIDNRFEGPEGTPAPSFDWDWKKVDAGLRVGLTANVDVTVEYSFNWAIAAYRTIKPNETLATVRFAF
jgi:hypothetical protein